MSVHDTERARNGGGRAAAGRLGVAAALAAAFVVPATAQESEAPFDYDAALAESGIDGSYGYFRTLDGSATVVQAGGERIQIEANEPVLVGDVVFVGGGSRAELVLADRNLVRVGDEAELGFRALAYSADRADPTSILDLRRGTLQLVVVPGQLGQDFPSIVTPNSTVQARSAGTYLIVVDDEEHTEVVVREGRADVLTADDGAEVRPGESVFVEGRGTPRLRFAAAPSVDRLEHWGNQLSEYGYVEGEYIDDDLRYAASDLDDHGSWVSVGGSYAWRPYVGVGWSPYRDGRWRYTPSGLFWVSYEPWGWVPYHYGYWDYADAYGWVWFPGRRFAPAHVYWYWGPHYAGWVPAGYYARHYGHRYGSGFGFYFGVYGTVGGGYAPYRYWTFCPVGRLGNRRQSTYVLHGYELGRRGARLDNGILTTDTRALRPDVWRRPTEGLARLRSLGQRNGRTLPNANAFIERTPRLPADLERVTLRGADRGARANGAATRINPAGLDARRPAAEARARNLEGRAPRLDARAGPAQTGPVAGTLRTSPGTDRRATGTLRRPEAGALRRPDTGARTPTATPARPATGANDRSSPASPRRPETRSRQPGTTLRRPTTPDAGRPTVERRSAGSGSGQIRAPETRTRPGGQELRRPTQPPTRSPAARGSSPGTRATPTRPTVELRSAPSSRPTLRRGSPTQPDAALRRAPASTNRPTLRRPTAPVRPTVGRSPQPTSRPTVQRSSGGSGARPAVRRPTAPARPTVRRSPQPTSRPTVQRSSGSGASRPTVKRSSGSGASRPTVKRSSGSGGPRPAIRRGSGRGSNGNGSD